ncbi:hypothetical protein H0H92_001221 [Tricholoma furcatifolium]|nr:hypothetical protein H0H92_001221 [Tricholoma furcatifolium]
MPDYSVYVTVVNKTNEELSNGYSHSSHGTWYRFPSWVAAGHTESFQLQDAKGWWFGSEGSFGYDLKGHGGSASMFSTYQRDPWTENESINKVDITDHPGPLSIYDSYFRAKSGDQKYYGSKNNYPTGGHPLYVEYTIDYTAAYKRTLKFKLTRINAISMHPVRNSDDRLISGNHIVWDPSNSSSYKDGSRGSKQPNIFGYRFSSSVKDTGILSVTLRALDSELSGMGASLTGTRQGDAKAQFGPGHWGGYFYARRYGMKDPNDNIVNCMDQNAAVQLGLTLQYPTGTTWLFMQDFGFINTTRLVGIRTDLNNPFYANPNIADPYSPTGPLLAPTNPNRTRFGCHVFLGNSTPNPWTYGSDDGIYDACSGPAIGDRNLQQYIDFAIDNAENTRRHYRNIDQWQVLIGYGAYSTEYPAPYPPERDSNSSLFVEPEAVSRLVNALIANSTRSLAHVDWLYLPTWLKSTLGDSWDVHYEEIHVGKTGARAYWRISDTNVDDGHISVEVLVSTAVAEDGKLDVKESTTLTRQHVSDLIRATQRDDAWEIGNIPGFGACLQHAGHVAHGKIVLVVGNIVMDIARLLSTEALLPTAHKLFKQTAVKEPVDPAPPAVPVLEMQEVHVNDGDAGVARVLEDGTIRIDGLHTRFSIVFAADCKVGSAQGGCDGEGVLFDE